jgi:hypothetical protein
MEGVSHKERSRRRSGRICLAFFALAIGPVTASAQPAPSPSPDDALFDQAIDDADVNLGVKDADAARVADLVAKLGDPSFEVREQASAKLAELCPGAFRQLARAYREIDDYETRLRIEEIVRDRYLWHTLLKHNGFLGVGYPPNGFEELPDGSIAVPLTLVSPGSAAEEAGLNVGDKVRSIDGASFSDRNNDAFRKLIQDKGAGAKIALEVVRGRRTLLIEVTLRARPIDQYTQPELLDELNRRMQDYTMWWRQFFGLPSPRTDRTPSTTVLELPE